MTCAHLSRKAENAVSSSCSSARRTVTIWRPIADAFALTSASELGLAESRFAREEAPSQETRNNFPHERQVLAGHGGHKGLDSRDVAARVGEAGRYPRLHEIPGDIRDDWDRACHLLHSHSLDAAIDNEDVHARSHKFGG